MDPIERTQRPSTTSGFLLSLRPSNLSIAIRSSIRNLFTLIYGHSIGSHIEKCDSPLREEMFIQQGPGSNYSLLDVAGLVSKHVTIKSLPDEVLLEMFQFYRVAVIEKVDVMHDVIRKDPNEWHRTWPRLVHVCRRWRGIIFASPLCLDLQLYCTPKTPVRRMLNVWPELPLAICWFDREWERHQLEPDLEDSLKCLLRWDNVIAAMECRDRVRQIIFFDLSSSRWPHVSTILAESFPALTAVTLFCEQDPGPVAVLPNTFLNGSAPHLQHLTLRRISFPSLRKFLLSTSDLTYLDLAKIPNDGYISPEAMATCLSALTKLESLGIEFASPTPQPKRRARLPPPHTRSVLSTLTVFSFKGVSEYLEVLAARIHPPMLELFWPRFFNQLVFDIPQISWLICNLRIPRPSGLSLRFSQDDKASVTFSWPRTAYDECPILDVEVLGNGLDWQVFSVAQICNQILPLCSSVVWLNVEYHKSSTEPPPRMRPEDTDHRIWLELFHSFISVKRIEICDELEPFVAAVLQGITKESATEVFPTLDSLFVVGNMNTSDRATQQGIVSFLTARQHSDHPVSSYRLDRWTNARSRIL